MGRGGGRAREERASESERESKSEKERERERQLAPSARQGALNSVDSDSFRVGQHPGVEQAESAVTPGRTLAESAAMRT